MSKNNGFSSRPISKNQPAERSAAGADRSDGLVREPEPTQNPLVVLALLFAFVWGFVQDQDGATGSTPQPVVNVTVTIVSGPSVTEPTEPKPPAAKNPSLEDLDEADPACNGTGFHDPDEAVCAFSTALTKNDRFATATAAIAFAP